MRSKKKILSNFSHSLFRESTCLRPDNEEELAHYMALHPHQTMLARGSGLSYNDSCFNTNGSIIDSERLNHFIHFDIKTGLVTCQGGVLLKDLFLVHPDYIPPVLPGTVHATVAGSIAHDVHGKNNHHEGSFGHHLIAFDLLIGEKTMHCSRHENTDLFYATIAGLGLTGIITRATLRLKKASHFVHVEQQQFEEIPKLLVHMVMEGIHHDYQVAWLDLLNPTPRALFSRADYCEPFEKKELKRYTFPKIPFTLIRSWNIKLFNQHYYKSKKTQQKLALEEFNNPLDKLVHWNRVYGPKGLIQFQTVFSHDNGARILDYLVQLIRKHKAIPTLAVLKLFTQSGEGLLSFCKPGFTLAIDFINNEPAKRAVSEMNQFIADQNGRIYLAKDLFLDAIQFKKMYENHEQFSHTLVRNGCTMLSDLSIRLGINK